MTDRTPPADDLPPDTSGLSDATSTPDATDAELAELAHDGHTRAELRRARRAFLLDAAMEAERDTGRREKTDEEAKHSLWMRVARLLGGWVLVLLGLAAIPLPGPGWLMVLLGLTLLPYRWTDNLIREIRKRIPGIPEDGRIPTRTWIVTGLLVALATGASVWWGLRDQDDDEARSTDTEQAADARAGSASASSDGPTIVTATVADPARQQLSELYGAVAAVVTDGRSRTESSTDLCSAVTSGDADLVLLTEAEVPACFGPAADQVGRASDAGVKMFAPVVTGGVTYVVAIRTDAIAVDDEPAELTIDGVSEHISAGNDISGDPAERARSVLADVGMLK